MDIATVLGIVSAFGLVLAAMASGTGLATFINIPSLMIVVGGTIGVVLVNFPLKDVLGLFGTVKNAFFSKKIDYQALIAKMVEFSSTARKQGILALERQTEQIEDEFLRRGLQMAVDGLEPDVIRSLIDKDMENMDVRHRRGADILQSFGTFAPALGLIGTLIGLVQMLKSMDDPSNIGPAMAVALITTFYGALLANLLFLPLAGKLRNRSQEELIAKEMILEGILSIAMGDNPRVIEAKLQAFLPPKQRKSSFDS
ncbi:MAG TPA: motility protein A [Proteobacteria bacterium]|nr:motility protein A [Pseudomonadota bacterium]